MQPPQRIIRRNGDLVDFDAQKISRAIYRATAALGRHDQVLADRLSRRVVELLTGSPGTPSVEEVQDLVERVLIEQNQPEVAKAYILYRQDRARVRTERTKARAAQDIPYKLMWQALSWNMDHDCSTLEGLNRHIRTGSFAKLVKDSEGRFEDCLRSTSEAILAQAAEIRVIIVAGPSSSGKTTITRRISQQLAAAGKEVVPLALDHYFFDLHLHPRDDSGDYDFETPEAIDIGLLNLHLPRLLHGDEVQMPIYDFQQGKRLQQTRPLKLQTHQTLVLDSLHGLYAPLTQSVDDEAKFRIYVEPVLQIRDRSQRWVRWTDLRLLRRMQRDRQHRNSSLRATLAHWHYVRRSELKHIIPHQHSADVVLNGSLPYELPIFKPHLAPDLPRLIAEFAESDQTMDAHVRARRLLQLFGELEGIDATAVPAISVLREFIGGSAFDMH